MEAQLTQESAAATKIPCNKGKIDRLEATAPDQERLVNRNKLQVDGHLRDLAMFNLAIDSKLRGCDVVTLRGRHRASWSSP